MKKVIFVLMLSVISVAVIAQVTVGLKAGTNITNFSGGDFDEVKKKAIVGFHGGGYLNFSLGAISLQPEILFSTQGARIDSVSGSYDWKVNYLTVPVMFKYRSAGGFYLEAGPQFGFKLSEEVKYKTIDAFATDLDLSAGIGLGFQSSGGFGIGARYLAGLSKVGDFDPSESGGIDPDFKNSVLQLGVFFKISK